MSELLRVEGLTKHFPIKQGVFSRSAGFVYAVDGVDFAVPATIEDPSVIEDLREALRAD